MPTNTYVELNNTVTTGSATTLTWSSIPSTYTDLVIVGYCKAVSPGGATFLTFNGDTATNYSRTRILGTGSAASSVTVANRNNIAIDAPSTEWSNFIVNVQNYSNTTTFKTALNRSNSDLYVAAQVGTWRNTAAITSITLTIDGGSFANGSTFSLYGIASEAAGAKATGGIITSDANYYYHTFLSTGTFTPLQSLSCDMLVVAGGGGGGSVVAGGGGAGGLLGFNSQSLTATNYTVTVGAGGAGGTYGGGGYGSGNFGSTGNDSQFGALTLVKGGGYGAPNDRNGFTTGGAGGSGGGGGSSGATNGPGGAATSGQGQAGGASASDNNTYRNTGAGGGAGNTGSPDATSTRGGIGGVGSTAYSSWGLATGTGQNVSGTVYYAGGGGAGQTPQAGGLGGGAAGGTNAGLTNTGGGGGGSAGLTAGGAGGSGVVIVRYAK